eukprot:9665-Heterocapsa_arctica.AAC.1
MPQGGCRRNLQTFDKVILTRPWRPAAALCGGRSVHRPAAFLSLVVVGTIVEPTSSRPAEAVSFARACIFSPSCPFL